MKQHILPAIRLTALCMVFFMAIYSFVIWLPAQAAPNRGKGETVIANNKVVGWKLIGQKFTDDKYFWSRPSAVDYNAAASGGSNKGPTNPGYLKQVQERIDSFLVHNPGIAKSDVPSDLVTASGAGLDPHISVQGAYVQVKRIASVRNLSEQSVKSLVDQHIEKPLLGLFGTQRINVLHLNIDLDKLK
ncbi:MAG TPA: K(+)-transporting ATPase subunit C [Flavisolibacter sp.]|jgi:potassium-transporting ATPase KdpC subunit|nr:K(+)-transporting ATPase subunit C [Flavisolibacter sp.]